MYWNWNLAPEDPLTKDFIFMPEVWGAGVVNQEWVRQADSIDFEDGHGKRSPAQMANVMMGMNEPDIQGSCMGNMFGRCVKHLGRTLHFASSASLVWRAVDSVDSICQSRQRSRIKRPQRGHKLQCKNSFRLLQAESLVQGHATTLPGTAAIAPEPTLRCTGFCRCGMGLHLGRSLFFSFTS